MKKIKIIVGIMAFILLTCILSINNQKIYVKKKHFGNSAQVLEQLTKNDLRLRKNGEWEYINSDAFNECLSKRIRLTCSNLSGIRMEIKEEIQLSDKEREEIKKDYNNLLKNYKNVGMKITKIEPVKFKARFYNENYYDTDPEIKEEDKYYDELITLVLIDEGEGMVIDYIVEDSIESMQDGEKS